MDDTDRHILTLLQDDARIANAEIARRVGLAPSAVHDRIRKLENRGVLRGSQACIDPNALDLGLLAFVFVGVAEFGSMTSGDRLAELPEVLEVHHVAGDDSWLVKVRTRDPASLGKLLNEKIGAIPHVTSTRTTVVLDSVKETGRLPIPGPQEEPEGEASR